MEKGSMSDRVQVGIVGAGHWGPHLIRNFYDRENSRVAWVADQDASRLSEVRARFPALQTTESVEKVLEDNAVDAIVVATPTSTHHRIAKAALEHDKHVLVEKPISTTVAEGEELKALADERARVLMVGHVFVYNAGVQRVKQIIDAGDLGRIFYISMVRTNLGPIRLDVNAAWDLAAHDISIVDYWLGTHALSAIASGGNWLNPGVEDAVFATLRYPADILVNLHVSWLNPRKARDITVVGEHHMLTLDDMNINEPLRIYDKRVAEARTVPAFADTFSSFRASIREGDITIPKVALGEPLQSECDHFIECIRHGKQPLTGAVEGIAVVRALQAIQRSMSDRGREAVAQ